MTAAPGGPLYIDDALGNIGTVNIQTRVVTVLGNSGVLLTDLAFTSDGNLYGTSFNGLYSINKTNGAATLILNYGALGAGGMNALVGAGTVLYAASSATKSLYSINEATLATATLSGQLAGNSAGDLAFSGNFLYETQLDGNLSAISLGNGSVTASVVGGTGVSSVFGLATADNGVTYAAAGTKIYTANLATGALTAIFDYSASSLGFANGTAFFGESGVTTTTNPDGTTSVAAATGGNTIRVSSGSVNTGSGGNVVILGAGPVTVQAGGSDTIFGGGGTDTVIAGPGAVVATGGAGALVYNAGSGNSTVFSGSGGLTFKGGSGTATVVAGPSKATITGGSGGGVFFGGGNSTIMAGAGAQTVMVGTNGDQLFSSGSTGDLFGVTGGSVTMSGITASGNDVFFGAAGTDTLTFITGSGNDVLGLGQGTNLVSLGAGQSTVFDNTGTTSVSTITMGTGSAGIVLGGASVNVLVAAGSMARLIGLYNFVPGADKVSLSGFASNTAATALATQTTVNGSALLNLGDGTTVALLGIARAPTNLFG